MKSTRNPNPPPPPELGHKRAFKEVKKSSQLQIRIEPEFEAKLERGAVLCHMSKSAFVIEAINEKLAKVNEMPQPGTINGFNLSEPIDQDKQKKTVLIREKSDYITP